MTQYENQMAALRIEVKRLRNYDCYSKDIPFQELQTEVWISKILCIMTFSRLGKNKNVWSRKEFIVIMIMNSWTAMNSL